jgi:hypothetical protein
MAAEYVTAEKNNVHHQDEASHPNPEAVGKTKGHDCVIKQKSPNQVGEAQKVTMEILHDQGEASLAQIRLAWFTDCARRRIGPERLVIRAPVVVTGEPEEARDPKDEKRGREVQKTGIPGWFGTEQCVRRGPEEFGRIER